MIKFAGWLSGSWQMITMAYVGVTGTLPGWCRWSFIVFASLVVLWWSIKLADSE